MSRIGKTPIIVPKEATVQLTDNKVMVKGPKGELNLIVPHGIAVAQKENVITIEKISNAASDAIHGFVRAELSNLIEGVTKGWNRTLELSGVGFRATMQGANLVLTIGFSHPVTVVPMPGITLSVVEGKIVVFGIDKHMVGQQAANIRAIKKPEPYKGKGIKYQGEHIRKKAGKSAKAVGGAPGGK